MKRLLVLLFIATFATSVWAGEIEQLTIVHTNDLHAHIMRKDLRAGFAKIAAFIKKERAEKKNILVLDAGDAITGTPVSTIYKGDPVFEIMSLMEYDASALGNHEFDWGWKKISDYKKLAKQPFLCANAIDPNGELIADAPYKIFNINGIKVGVIGLLVENLSKYVLNSGITGVKVLPEIETMRKFVNKLRPECDFLIALTHIGLEKDEKLAENVKGIDLIVGGHSHSVLKEPVKINDTYIVQTGRYGRYVGVVEVKIDTGTKKVLSLVGTLVNASAMPAPDKEIEKLVDSWEKKIAPIVDEKIGVASKTFDLNELKVLFQKILKQKAKTDFGYYNIGGIRDTLHKGKISRRSIWNIEPFSNDIAIVTIKGENIGGALLRRLRRENVDIKAQKEYTIATNNYILGEPGRFIGTPSESRLTGILVRDTVIDYVIKKGGL